MNRSSRVLPIIAAVLLVLAAPFSTLAAGLPAAPPESLGFSPERLKRIDALMQRYVDDRKLAGVTIAIARDGKVAYLKSAGMADIAARRPMQADTLARFYSMSKPITAVAVMMLVEEGKLRLTDKLSDYLPEFKDMKVFAGKDADDPATEPAKQPIRIFNLLTHTSGLTYGGSDMDPSPVGTIYNRADVLRPDRTLDEFSRLVASLPLSKQPGTDYQYGVSIDVLGRLVEVISGKPFEVYLKERIFDPLAMVDTSFTVPAGKAARFAEIYDQAPGGGLRPVPSEEPRTRFREGAKFKSGGGGLVSTVGDYLRFCQMMLNGGELDGVRLLSPKTVALMTTGQLPPERTTYLHGFMPGYGVGLGFAVLEDLGKSELPGSVGEYNWAGAANTYFFVDPKEKLIAVLVTQLFPPGQPLREDLKAVVYQALVEARDAR